MNTETAATVAEITARLFAARDARLAKRLPEGTAPIVGAKVCDETQRGTVQSITNGYVKIETVLGSTTVPMSHFNVGGAWRVTL